MIDFENDLKLFPGDIKAQSALRLRTKERMSFDEYFLFLESINGLFKFESPKQIKQKKITVARFEL